MEERQIRTKTVSIIATYNLLKKVKIVVVLLSVAKDLNKLQGAEYQPHQPNKPHQPHQLSSTQINPINLLPSNIHSPLNTKAGKSFDYFFCFFKNSG